MDRDSKDLVVYYGAECARRSDEIIHGIKIFVYMLCLSLAAGDKLVCMLVVRQ
jgi:hypothetical protein